MVCPAAVKAGRLQRTCQTEEGVTRVRSVLISRKEAIRIAHATIRKTGEDCTA